MIELHILGSPRLTNADGAQIRSVLNQPKRLAMLSYLAVTASDGLQRRDRLLALFWPESDEKRARSSLSESLSRLRKSLGPRAIVKRGNDEVGIDPEWVRCDVALFDAAVQAGDCGLASALYRGPLLDGFMLDNGADFDHWLESTRARLQRRAVDFIGRHADELFLAGDETALECAERTLQLAPLDGDAASRVMRFMAEAGHRAEAIRVYERFAERLGDELGIEPSGSIGELLQSIRHGVIPSLEEAASGLEPRAGARLQIHELASPADPSGKGPGPEEGTGQGATGVPIPDASPGTWERVGLRLHRSALTGLAFALVAVGLLALRSELPIVRQDLARPMDQPSARVPLNDWVAVAPFGNAASDVELDYLGTMIGQGIESGLLSTGELTVVPIDLAETEVGPGPLAEEAAALAEVARRRGARWLVRGSFAASGNEVQVNLRVTDTREGEPVYATFARAPREDLIPAVDAVRERAMTLLHASALGLADDLPASELPGYDSFYEFAQGMLAWDQQWTGGGGGQRAVDHFRRAFEMDERMHAAAVQGLLSWGTFAGALDAEGPANRPYFEEAVSRITSADPYTRAAIEFASSVGDGWNVRRRYWGAVRMFELRPDRTIIFGAAFSAIRYNRPAKALEVDMWAVEHLGRPLVHGIGALHMLGRYGDVLEHARDRPSQLEAELAALAALGRDDEVLARIDEVFRMGGNPAGALRSIDRISDELESHGSPDAARELRDRYAHVGGEIAVSLLLKNGRVQDARRELERLEVADEIQPDFRNYYRATIELRQGDPSFGEAWLSALPDHHPSDWWFSFWALPAAFEAERGNLDEAMRYLRMPGENWGFHQWWHSDTRLLPLHGYPEFELWIEPKD